VPSLPLYKDVKTVFTGAGKPSVNASSILYQLTVLFSFTAFDMYLMLMTNGWILSLK
jgi:hypothetical protein